MTNLIFDKTGKLIRAEGEDFSIKYIWDNNGNLIFLKRNDESWVKFIYDDNNILKETKFSTGDWIKNNRTNYTELEYENIQR